MRGAGQTSDVQDDSVRSFLDQFSYTSTPPHSASGSLSPVVRRTRRKSGCMTCRLRKKRCDEQKPECATCTRLGLECMGYGSRRPEWMSQKDRVDNAMEKLKHTMAQSKARKLRQRWSADASKVARTVHDEKSDNSASSQAASDSDQKDIDQDPTQKSPPDQEDPSNYEAQQSTPRTGPRVGTSGELAPDALFSQSPLASHETTSAGIRLQPFTHNRNYAFDQDDSTGDTVIEVSSLSHSTHEPLLSLDHAASIHSTLLSLDPEVISLLGLSPHSSFTRHTPNYTQPMSPFDDLPGSGMYSTPAIPHPMSDPTIQTPDLRYVHHYLNIILPMQYRFDNQPISNLVGRLALTHTNVSRSLASLAALHMAAQRHRRPRQSLSYLAPDRVRESTSALGGIPSIRMASDPDLIFARSEIEQTIQRLKMTPSSEFGSDEVITTAMSALSFHLYDGGNRKGWQEAANLCRRCLVAVLGGESIWLGHGNKGLSSSVSSLLKRLGHLISPLMWIDILTSVTENKASALLPLYRLLLPDALADSETGKLLRETVMGCDSTTRLALAETIQLSEWRTKMVRAGCLSARDLVQRASAVERLLEERWWREAHLFDSTDQATYHRRLVSDVFYNGVKVLLATTVDGAFPSVPDVASAVQATADALMALDRSDAAETDRVLILPIVIAGCHAELPALQKVFEDRFEKLGDDAATFGNTRNALLLMKEVWKRRAASSTKEYEVHWRSVMFDLNKEGLLLI